MTVINTKTVHDFKFKGFYNPMTNMFTNDKGNEVFLPDVLAAFAKTGDVISIAIKHEQSVEQTLDEFSEEE
ncbi:hypothetical protein [Siminovitchia fordii]|uniref:Uncharacterized protein n=1 Tax=Siminovitchia fordii TaxID=254759 RepID=A0ABQ4KBJ3_9BACI|nr:hypothetical protein [Siminovitchia fordii]GIN23101.1 hypothetical protein J1TS3_42350 [Siminovitchia fordii]